MPALLLVYCLSACSDARAAQDLTSSGAVWQSLAIVGGVIIAVGGVVFTMTRLTDTLGAWAWALIRPRAEEETSKIIARVEDLEERSGTHQRALYGDEHQSGLIDQLRILQSAQDAALNHLAQLRRDAIDASDRHTAALRELAEEMRRGDR